MRIDELMGSLPAKLQAVAQSVHSTALGFGPRISKSYDRNVLLMQVTKKVNLDGADARSRPTLERLVKDLCILGDVRAQIRLRRSLRS